MDKSTLISIIIPFYNAGQLLSKCVKSIADQTYKNLEIILVNDGSDDISVDIAKRLADNDKRIILLCMPHSGVSAARNKGLEAATGRYVMFADSDDRMNPKIIKRMMKIMMKNDVDMVECGVTKTDVLTDRSLPENVSFLIYSHDEYMRMFFKINSNKMVHYPVGKLYKKELLPDNLYPADIRIGEDVIGTYLSLTNVRRVAVLKDTGYYYYRNPHSTTARFSEKDFDLIKVWDRMMELTKGVSPDHYYAKIGRDRINFTLLLRMMTQLSPKEMEHKFPGQRKKLLGSLKEKERELLGAPIVPSRKVMIFMVCHFYEQMAWIRKIL